MRIPIDVHSPVPLYRQISSHLSECITKRQLAIGSRLPSSRELAATLGVSRITVEGAYAELEADGLVEKRMGSGTYVLDAADAATANGLSVWKQQVSASPFSGQLRLQADATAEETADIISFAEGSGDSAMYPVNDFRSSLQNVMRKDPMTALGYGDSWGLPSLRKTLAQILTSQGLPASAESILITAGSQQALALTLQVLLNAGDTVVVETPTYARALELMSFQRLRIIGIPMDEDGMDIDALEAVLATEKVKLIYTMPNFQNPTGLCLSSPRRRHLVNLAARYGVMIFEDDYVGDLRYDGLAQPALRSLDTTGNVVYTSTFSKMLLPGLRVGFVLADNPLLKALHKCKLSQDLATSSLMQHALGHYLNVGRYRRHLRISCRAYRERRDALCDALSRECSDEIIFTRPSGGLFIWTKLTKNIPAGLLARRAYEQGVSVSPGEIYSVDPATGSSFLRLNFAAVSAKRISEGVRRLNHALKLTSRSYR